MSVVIKGMKYPESCAECALWMYDDQGAMCPFKEHKYISDGDWQPPSDTEKGEWCPLAPMPEKHGRLIDADDMERFMSDTVQGDIRQYPYSDTLWDMAFKWIDSRPTIVEAEGE